MASSLGELFLDYHRHPPIPVDGKAKLVARKMDIIDISVSWYSAQLASAPPGSITLWMRRLEMMLSYIDKLDVGGIASHFQEPIRRMGSGTMVADFRRIARWKQQDVRKEGLQLKTTEAKEETFGQMKSSSIWRLILDLTVERPSYPLTS
ncbi:hypothetical protein BS47DRAFT_1396865 [Hydnum rufescens UP504]|uniref:Uncharacterized protein n=1 Tax=Hydnum rufescens UP504 TaxID=1448309 RepID=A0A9P6DPX0_9AGAM|nr:hypothetical protein BS47DRAFT_1396865 [Hydnum rufescens UP504]